jgi:hypothetical protein
MIIPSQLALKTTQILDVLAASQHEQTSRQISGGKSSLSPPIGDISHSCYEASGKFNYTTNANCDGTTNYNNPVYTALKKKQNAKYCTI